MDALFLKLLNMSITASWLILAAAVLRLLLKKAPKWIICLLWALVAVRLICPFTLESSLSVVPSDNGYVEEWGSRYSGDLTFIPEGNTRYNAAIDGGYGDIIQGTDGVSYVVTGPDGISKPKTLLDSSISLWLIGVAIMLLYTAVSYLRLRRRVRVSIHVRDNLWICDDIKTPFILGVFKPQIYLPSGMEAETEAHVLAHENAHLKRRDHLWKPLGFLLLAVYWFNPLCWLAYILLCRDIELACDEKVIRSMEKGELLAYSQALLACSVPRRMVMVCPLAFGEVGVRERIKAVLNYKKPTFWIIVAAAAACVIVAVCFLTNPVTKFSDKSMKAEAWPLAQSCAMVNGVEISESNAQLSRSADGAAIEVLYPTSSEGEIRVIFAMGDGVILSAATVFEHAQLSLDDVIILSHFGEELTWADFDAYDFVETGSGLYIRVYEIDEQFSLMIGGGPTDEPPMYIRLVSRANPDDYVDIRREDVEKFIETTQSSASVATVSGADTPAQPAQNTAS